MADDTRCTHRRRPSADPKATGDRRTLYQKLDDIYVTRPEDEILAECLEDMVDRTLTGREGRAVVLAGASGSGKTTMIEHAAREHPDLSLHGETPGMIFVQVPASCTVADLGTEIARAAGYPLKDGLKASVAWGAAMRQMRLMNIRHIWLDEVTNLADVLNAREARKVRTHLKMALINRHHRVGLVLSGVTEVLGFLLDDPQVLRRSEVVEILPVHDGMIGIIAKSIRTMAGKAGLDVPSDLRREVVPRLSHACLESFGTCMEMSKQTIQRAARRRVTASDAITPNILTLEDFATMWARKYGVSATENPFVLDDWARIDCAAVVSRRPIVVQTTAPARGRGGQPKVRGGVV